MSLALKNRIAALEAVTRAHEQPVIFFRWEVAPDGSKPERLAAVVGGRRVAEQQVGETEAEFLSRAAEVLRRELPGVNVSAFLEQVEP